MPEDAAGTSAGAPGPDPNQPTYPHVHVQLTGHNGNAYNIIGRVAKAIRNQIGDEAARQFTEAAFAARSYDDLLYLAMCTVDVH
jgi:hypothetical protein